MNYYLVTLNLAFHFSNKHPKDQYNRDNLQDKWVILFCSPEYWMKPAKDFQKKSTALSYRVQHLTDTKADVGL